MPLYDKCQYASRYHPDNPSHTVYLDGKVPKLEKHYYLNKRDEAKVCPGSYQTPKGYKPSKKPGE